MVEKYGTTTDDKVREFKQLVTKELTPFASEILLDSEYDLLAAKARFEKTGLLLAYEKTGYDTTKAGRMPDLLPDWSVQRLKEKREDACKFYCTMMWTKSNRSMQKSKLLSSGSVQSVRQRACHFS